MSNHIRKGSQIASRPREAKVRKQNDGYKDTTKSGSLAFKAVAHDRREKGMEDALSKIDFDILRRAEEKVELEKLRKLKSDYELEDARQRRTEWEKRRASNRPSA